MSGHLHKSALGSNRKVTAPPESHHGKPWWTTPPTVLPLDEHIAYAQEYQAQLIGTKAGRKDGATRMELLTRVSAWLRAANRLRHSTPVELGDLRSDDEYILAANRIIGALFATLARAGVDPALTPECQAMRFAVEKRAEAARLALMPREVAPQRFAAEVAKGRKP